MMDRPPWALGYYSGSHWLQTGVAAVLLGILLFWLLEALQGAQEFSERTLIELTVRDMRVGLQIAKGEALLAARDHEIRGWVGANPVRWLGRTPDGYLGECSSREAEALARGEWCFDHERRELAYRPRHSRYLRMPGGGSISGALRWRVALPPREERSNSGTPGVRLENVVPYVWREE